MRTGAPPPLPLLLPLPRRVPVRGLRSSSPASPAAPALAGLADARAVEEALAEEAREELVDGVCRGGARAVGNVCTGPEAEAFEDLAEVVWGSAAVSSSRTGRRRARGGTYGLG